MIMNFEKIAFEKLMSSDYSKKIDDDGFYQ